MPYHILDALFERITGSARTIAFAVASILLCNIIVSTARASSNLPIEHAFYASELAHYGTKRVATCKMKIACPYLTPH